MDSADFRLKGKSCASVKDPSWSNKENSLAQRFMFGTDLNTRIRVLDGWYSPKLYDGHWLRVKADELRSSLDGTVVLADSHFKWGLDNFSNIEFVSSFLKTKEERPRYEYSITTNDYKLQ